MLTYRWLMLINLLLVMLSAASDQAQAEPTTHQAHQTNASTSHETPNLGQRLGPDQTRSITIWPDGRGLPKGTGDPKTGREIYVRQCQACHGQEGKGGINGALAGGQVALTAMPTTRTVGSYWPYATTLFDYVNRAMPYQQPGSLSDDQTYAVVAYLLFLNGVIDEDSTLNAAQLSKLRLPNRARFYSDYELP